MQCKGKQLCARLLVCLVFACVNGVIITLIALIIGLIGVTSIPTEITKILSLSSFSYLPKKSPETNVLQIDKIEHKWELTGSMGSSGPECSAKLC